VIQDPDTVADHVHRGVGVGVSRRIGLSESAQIGRDRRKARFRDSPHLMAPHAPLIRKAVAEEHRWPCPAGNDVLPQAVDLSVVMLERPIA
jgi:hypothetical protein